MTTTPTEYQFCLYVAVTDEWALIAAARARMEAEGVDLEPDAEVSVTEALRWMLDPGSSPPGCEIFDSSCE